MNYADTFEADEYKDIWFNIFDAYAKKVGMSVDVSYDSDIALDIMEMAVKHFVDNYNDSEMLTFLGEALEENEKHVMARHMNSETIHEQITAGYYVCGKALSDVLSEARQGREANISSIIEGYVAERFPDLANDKNDFQNKGLGHLDL